MSEFETITLVGESLYCRPWENQRGSRFGPTDRDEYEVTLVNLSEEEMTKAVSKGRNPTMAARGSTKFEAGFKEYYKVTSLYKIPLADAQTNPIEDETFIPNGSKIKVYIEVRPIDEEYQKGNTHKFMCRGVQVLELADVPDNDWEPDEKAEFFEKEEGYDSTAANIDEVGFEKVLPEDEDPLA